MQRGKRDEDSSMQSISGSVHSKPGRAAAAGLGKATPYESYSAASDKNLNKIVVKEDYSSSKKIPLKKIKTE